MIFKIWSMSLVTTKNLYYCRVNIEHFHHQRPLIWSISFFINLSLLNIGIVTEYQNPSIIFCRRILALIDLDRLIRCRVTGLNWWIVLGSLIVTLEGWLDASFHISTQIFSYKYVKTCHLKAFPYYTVLL